MKFALYRLRVLVLANMLIAVSGSLAATEQPASTNSAGQDSAWNARGCFADQRGQWFRDAKFGAFIHFGAYSELGGYWQGKGPYDPAEQIIGLGDRHAVIPPDQYRKEVAGRFNPTNFNAKQWISLNKKAGQKYVIVTTKHHDGFCMFHTHTTTYNAVDSTPFARDVIRELSDECKRQGIAFCPYFSIGDWCASEVQKPEYPSYRDYMDAQLKELLSNYGEIKMLWFDNYWYVNNQWKNDLPHAKELYGFVHSLQPDMLVNDRCGRGASSTDGDYATPENQLKGSRQSRYFEVVMTDTRDDNWGWVRGATNYRQPAELIRNLIDCTSKGGNFVLNVGPMASGEFPPEHVALLEEIGKWTSINGEAIYGTVPAPECTLPTGSDCKCYATKNNDAIYVHVVQWPASSGDVSIQIDRTNLVDARFLDGSLAGLQYSRAIENGATIVTIKKPVKIDPYATVVKLTFKAAGAK